MPTPTYILELRERIGTALLFLPGVSGVVLRGDSPSQQLLLVRRADNGRWALPAGIVEPGEQPAECIRREIVEETRVDAVVERLALLAPTGRRRTQRRRLPVLVDGIPVRYVGGEAAVGDEESTDVGWYPLDALPELSETDLQRIAAALPERGETVFWPESDRVESGTGVNKS